MFFEKGEILAAAAIEAKLPAFCQAVPGCLANYQVVPIEVFSIAGAQVAHVLQGPGLPSYLYNRRARLAIPDSVLARADMVIE